MISVNDFNEFGKRVIAESLKEIQNSLSATAKEIEKQKNDFHLQGLFRKIFFWATPIFLLVQTIILLIFAN